MEDINGWHKSDEEMPEETTPYCQNCYTNPFREIPQEVYRMPCVTVCRHDTNHHYPLKIPVLVWNGPKDVSMAKSIVDYRGRMSGSGAVTSHKAWNFGMSHGTKWTEGTYWRYLPPDPVTR